MKKINYVLLFICLFLFSTLRAQSWVENTAAQGLIPIKHQIADIDALTDSVVWILTHYLPETTTETLADTLTYSKILRTINGGNSWQVFEIPASKGRVCVDIEATDSLNVWVTTVKSLILDAGIEEGILFNTKDGGRTWTEK
jgi:hypothetical protein